MRTDKSFEERGFRPVFPSGWYQIAWSPEVPAGDVVPLRYFERDLVLYRGHDGVARLLDAHCVHLGAHLGYGGTVVDDALQCPFHGWRWGPTGENLSIPYSTQICKRRLGVWEVVEEGGLIFTWYDHDGRPPLFDAPVVPEIDDDMYFAPYPTGVRLWQDVRIHPQSPIENLVDPAGELYVLRENVEGARAEPDAFVSALLE